MEQNFSRIAPGLYEREYATATGESSVLYYGRLKSKDGKRQLFALGAKSRAANRAAVDVSAIFRDLSRKAGGASAQESPVRLRFREAPEQLLRRSSSRRLQAPAVVQIQG